LCRQYQPAELPEPIGQEAKTQLLEAYRRMLAARATPPVPRNDPDRSA
jgi:hypothetical protein